MPRLRVHNLSLSLDGYAAGPDQGLDAPLGVGGEQLHEWIFTTAYWRRMIGEAGGSTGPDNDHLVRGDENIGATIMGRNMFGPVRGDWGSREWADWWGEDPPFHHDVFVLTHYARDPVPMAGGTTFHFVTDGIEAALERARAAAGDRHVRLGGGASTVRQYLRAGLLDELHVAEVPVLLGSGERLFGDLGDALDDWTCVEFTPSPAVAHVRLRRG
jgi:dihydrofolate reductase